MKKKLPILLVAEVGGFQLSPWMILPLGVCFYGQTDNHLRWGRKVMAGLPELSIPRGD